MTDEQLDGLVAEVVEHCVGSGRPSVELLEHGRFPKNWVQKYLALLERCESVLAERSAWPRDLVAALHFASLYLLIRYDAWHRGTGATRDTTERGLRRVRARTEMLFLQHVPAVSPGDLEPMGAGAPPSDPFPASVGGLVDEACVALCIYAEDLDPEEVTRVLGLTPTRSHRRGDRKGPKSPPFVQGAWIREVRCEAPVAPDAALSKLLDDLPRGGASWSGLVPGATVQVRIACHFTGWNKAFGFSPENIRRLGELGVEVNFDLYGEGDDGDAA